jgi:predicted nucleotidyltransferase component of viral defense system
VRLAFVNEVSKRTGVRRVDLIEKDILLHELLANISQSPFADKLLFKGGTCLIKGYIGYFRFSEDIDFTWQDQTVFEGLSKKQLRSHLSGLIDDVGKLFEEISAKRGLDFRCVKSDRNYVELGGSDKICTFKLWYESETLRRRSFIKVQVNFVEKLVYPPKTVELRSLLTDADARTKRELGLLYPEQFGYLRTVPFKVYDVREVLAEKIRAILTREGIKARDYLDVYVIGKWFGYRPGDVLEQSLDKIRFTLGMYEKYRRHFEAKRDALVAVPFAWGEERGLVLEGIDEAEFYGFLETFRGFMSKVIDSLG